MSELGHEELNQPVTRPSAILTLMRRIDKNKLGCNLASKNFLQNLKKKSIK